jgi:hypothetical protein
VNKLMFLVGTAVLLGFSGSSYAGTCREFTSTITVGNKIQQGVGTACQQPDGSWAIVSAATPENGSTNTMMTDYDMATGPVYTTTPTNTVQYINVPSSTVTYVDRVYVPTTSVVVGNGWYWDHGRRRYYSRRDYPRHHHGRPFQDQAWNGPRPFPRPYR